MLAEVPTFNVAAVPNPVILELSIAFTSKVIVPEDVIGEFATVNSEEPASAIESDVETLKSAPASDSYDVAQ